MKHVCLMSLVGLALGFGAAGCANQQGPFTISRFYSLNTADECSNVHDVPDELLIGNGYLDVAAGSPQYFIGVQIDGVATQPSQEVPGVVLEPEDRNMAMVEQTLVTYELSRSIGATPAEYVVNNTFPLTEKLNVAVQLISPELGQALLDNLAAVNDLSETVDINARVEFRGRYTRTDHAFTTGGLVFPIRAFKSDPVTVCTNGFAQFVRPSQLTDGGVGFEPTCIYVGQSYGQFAPPSPPFVCRP